MMTLNISILFYGRSNDLLSRLIKWWTRSKYYHVELVVNDKRISSDIERDVMVRSKHLVDPTDSGDAVYNTTVTVTKEQYEILMRWLTKVNGSKYDTLGILLSQILKSRVDDPNKWFCSELTTKVLQILTIEDVIDLTPNMLSPGDLARLFNVE